MLAGTSGAKESSSYLLPTSAWKALLTPSLVWAYWMRGSIARIFYALGQ